MRSSLTEAPSLHRHYPASSVVRASPPPHTARPISRELPVDRNHDHRWGFPCCLWSPMRTCHRHYPGRFNGACSLVYLHCQRPSPVTVRSAPAITFSGPAQRSLALWPARSRSRLATLYTESSDSSVASAAASIATGWSEPVPGRELHPLKSSAFHGALFRQLRNRLLRGGVYCEREPNLCGATCGVDWVGPFGVRRCTGWIASNSANISGTLILSTLLHNRSPLVCEPKRQTHLAKHRLPAQTRHSL